MAKDVSIRLEDDLYEALKAAALAERRAVAAFIRVLIEDHLAELAELERQAGGSSITTKQDTLRKAKA